MLGDVEQVKKNLRELFESQSLAVLATSKEGQSYASLVAFSATDDLESLIFATGRGTRKYANLSSNESVAMLIDNRSNRISDFRQAMAATATGRAEEVHDQERERLSAVLLGKHPHLREFVTAPSCAILRVRISTYYVVERFQNVMELHWNP